MAAIRFEARFQGDMAEKQAMSDASGAETPKMSNKAALKRRKRGFEAVGGLARGSTRPTLSARGISEIRLVAQWREIMGDDLASACHPVRLKSIRGGFGVGGVLVLAVSGARAAEIEHRGPQIVDRVNSYYGYSAVTALQLTQSVVRGAMGPAPKPTRTAPTPLTPAKREEIAALTDPIADDQLRTALARLGANVMRRGKRPRRPNAAQDP